MRAEVADSARSILGVTGSRRGLTFAYPCGNIGFGPPADQARNAALYLTYVAESYFAARTYNEAGTVDADALSVLTVPDTGHTVDLDFPGLLAMMDPALKSRNAGVFTFHGVGAEYLKVSNAAFGEMAEYLERHTEIWTTTFGDLIRYILESRALEIKPSECSATVAAFSLNWPMDQRVFDLPLSLKWTLPAGWTSVTAEGDGRSLTASVNAGAAPAVIVEVPHGTLRVRFERRNP